MWLLMSIWLTLLPFLCISRGLCCLVCSPSSFLNHISTIIVRLNVTLIHILVFKGALWLKNDSLMVCTSNQSYKHTSNCFTLIIICFYPFMSTLITATFKKAIVTQYDNWTCACLRRQIDQTKSINLGLYFPFNNLNFGTGLIVFD